MFEPQAIPQALPLHLKGAHVREFCARHVPAPSHRRSGDKVLVEALHVWAPQLVAFGHN